MPPKLILPNDVLPLTNYDCANCGQAGFATGDGTRPIATVLGSDTALIFCNGGCKAAWDKEHCAWCGKTRQTVTLSVSTGSLDSQRWFCDTQHALKYQSQSGT